MKAKKWLNFSSRKSDQDHTPLSHLNVDQFLGCPCLHPKEVKEVSELTEEKGVTGPQ